MDVVDAFASSLIGEVVSLGAGKAGSSIRSFAQQREIDKLVNETKQRASMSPLSAELIARIKDEHLVDELIANLELKKLTRDEAIGRFLASDTRGPDYQFLVDFCNQIDRILSPAEDSQAAVKSVRQNEEILSELKSMQESMRAPAGDIGAQIALLKTIIDKIRNGEVDTDHLEQIEYAGYGQTVSGYLNAYRSLCVGSTFKLSDLDSVANNDTLILALASVSLSSNRLDETADILKLCSFDTEEISAAIFQVLRGSAGVSYPIRIEADRFEKVNNFINLITFEKYFCLRNYLAAEELLRESVILWNPIALRKRHLVELNASFMLGGDVGPHVDRVIEDYRTWYSKDLATTMKTSLSAAFSKLSAQQARETIKKLPSPLASFAEDEEMAIRLRGDLCEDELNDIVVWASAKHNAVLLLESSIQLVKANVQHRSKVISIYEQSCEWAFPNVGILQYYIHNINPNITYEQYCRYGKDEESEPGFHLVAYETFHKVLPELSKKHIEKALSMMEGPSGAIDLLNSRIWVPYLVDNGRFEDIKQRVFELLPIAPYVYLMAFFEALEGCHDTEGYIDEALCFLAESEIKDSRVAELAAVNLAVRGRLGIAGRMARVLFEKNPSESLAQIIVQWACESSLDVDEEVLSFIKGRDNLQMNMLLADYYNAKGMRLQRNQFLIRLAFVDGEVAKKALEAFAIWNTQEMGDNEGESEQKEEVGPDCCVVLAGSGCECVTLYFCSDNTLVKNEGVAGPAGRLFSTNSVEYMRLRGLRTDSEVLWDGCRYVIKEIAPLDSMLCRAGFNELANNSGTTIVIGSLEELFSHLKEHAAQGRSMLDYYANGVSLDHGTIYLGIESGANYLAPTRVLEFILNVLDSPSLPYRKCLTSTNGTLDCEDRYLLSYNSVIILSMLELSDDILKKLVHICRITESTARRLEKDARAFVDEFYQSTGRLSFHDDRPILYEHDDRARQYAKKTGLSILEFMQQIGIMQPDLNMVTRDAGKALSDNSVIDIQTAKNNNYVYVTEDILESQIIDCFAMCRRCSIAAMLSVAGYLNYVMNQYVEKMADWGADPPLETDIASKISAIWQYLSEIFRSGSCEKEREDDRVDPADEVCIQE